MSHAAESAVEEMQMDSLMLVEISVEILAYSIHEDTLVWLRLEVVKFHHAKMVFKRISLLIQYIRYTNYVYMYLQLQTPNNTTPLPHHETIKSLQ